LKSLLAGFFLGLAITIVVVLLIPGHLGVDIESKPAPDELKPWVDICLAGGQINADKVAEFVFSGPPDQGFVVKDRKHIQTLLGGMKNAAKAMLKIPAYPDWQVKIVLKGKKQSVIGPTVFNSRSWKGTFESREFYQLFNELREKAKKRKGVLNS
jgi:hypothetical protein